MRIATLLLLALCSLSSSPAAADTSIGNIAVVETDPTIVQPGELFDLNGLTLTFNPKAGGGYTQTVGGLAFDSQLGTNLNLPDDGAIAQPLGFSFPFFGANYTTAFISSNGYVTFGTSSSFIHFNGQSGGGVSTLGDASTVLDRISEALPRIAVLWQDWSPSAPGGVFARSLSDRLAVTWNAVHLFNTATTATFQLVLFSNGAIQMSYQSVTSTPAGGYLVGISPGGVNSFVTTTLDLSAGSGASISTLPLFEPLVQVFGSSSSPLVQISAVARRFYRTHGDQFDQLVLFANFANALGSAFAFELNVQNGASGVNLPVFNQSSFWGSQGRLQSFLNMNRLGVYPADPFAAIPGLGTNNTLDVMGQEAGHAFLAYVQFDDAGVCSNLLLGRDLAHWSFFHHTDASDMEGNKWRDNSNGTFTSTDATSGYSPLDQYILGLRAASDVPSFFFIRNPTGTGGRTASSPPEIGVTVGGARSNVGVSQVMTCEGPRSPANGFSSVNPTTTWKQAFILLIPAGTSPPSGDVGRMDNIRSSWVSYFAQATGGRGAVDATIVTPPALTAAVLPGSRSVQVNTPATVFATIINASAATATGVNISLASGIPASFSAQTTNPSTNQVSGPPNVAVDIPGGQSQSYLLVVTPSAEISPTEVQFNFAASNGPSAPTLVGINTLLLSASVTATPDVIALAATSPNTGILRLPGPSGAGAFAVATSNVGASGLITVSVDTGATGVPVALSLCQTNPSTGQCISVVGATVTTQIDAGQTPTFAIFASAGGTIVLDPATNRIFVRFKDTGAVTRGSTSVAVTTQ